MLFWLRYCFDSDHNIQHRRLFAGQDPITQGFPASPGGLADGESPGDLTGSLDDDMPPYESQPIQCGQAPPGADARTQHDGSTANGSQRSDGSQPTPEDAVASNQQPAASQAAAPQPAWTPLPASQLAPQPAAQLAGVPQPAASQPAAVAQPAAAQPDASQAAESPAARRHSVGRQAQPRSAATPQQEGAAARGSAISGNAGDRSAGGREPAASGGSGRLSGQQQDVTGRITSMLQWGGGGSARRLEIEHPAAAAAAAAAAPASAATAASTARTPAGTNTPLPTRADRDFAGCSTDGSSGGGDAGGMLDQLCGSDDGEASVMRLLDTASKKRKKRPPFKDALAVTCHHFGVPYPSHRKRVSA